MRPLFPTAVLGVACLGLAGCAGPEVLTETADQAPTAMIQAAEVIPISFVTQFVSFDGGNVDPKGGSGRTQSSFCLTFSVQEGDLSGTLHT